MFAPIKSVKAFTLIELLVVVLIIGILAAVALPLYKTSVDKTRFTGLMPLSKSIKDAEERNWLAAGEYTSDISQLDVAAPADSHGETYNVILDADQQRVRATNPTIGSAYVAYFDKSNTYAGDTHCEAPAADAQANKICVAAGGVKIGSDSGNNIYLLSGKGNGNSGAGGTVVVLPPPIQIGGCTTDLECHVASGLCSSRCMSGVCQNLADSAPPFACSSIGNFCGGLAFVNRVCNQTTWTYDILGYNTSNCVPCVVVAPPVAGP